MIAQQVAGKAARDALFLAVYDAAELPKAMLATAALSLAGVAFMAQALGRFGPARLLPALLTFSAVAHAAEWFFAEVRPQAVAVVVYLHVAVLGALLISGFWTAVGERFDPHAARRVIARIGTGATAGGLAGGVVAERVAAWYDARLMLLVLAGMHLAGALGMVLMGAPARSGRTPPEPAGLAAGMKALAGAPYLKMVALLSVLTALTSSVVDYAFKAGAAAAIADRERLLSFFAVFYTATGLLTVIVQSTLARRALSRLGIGGTIALLPATVALFGVASAAALRLWAVVAMRAAEIVGFNAFYRAAYELLFTPVAAQTRRTTKTAIDVGGQRLGDALASGAVLLLLALAPAATEVLVVLLGVLVAGGTLLLALRLHRGYVAELASKIREGTVAIDEGDVVDGTTRRTMSETTLTLDREALLAEVAALRGDDAASEERASPIVADLCSEDPARVRAALRRGLDARTTGFVIPLLGDEVVARDAQRALVAVAPQVTGQLVDALLCDTLPEAVRRGIPEVLERCDSGLALRGLVCGLGAPPCEVRQRCGVSLGRLLARYPHRRLRPGAITEALARQAALDGQLDLDHAFRLIGLVLDADALELSLRALQSDDVALRGTSLEYLSNVLPPSVHELLWPQLKEIARGAPETARGARSTVDIETDLRARAARLDIRPTTHNAIWYRLPPSSEPGGRNAPPGRGRSPR